MKSKEEVQSLKEGDILWDKMTRDHEGNPLQWKVSGEMQIARHNKESFIRRIELVMELTDEEIDDLKAKLEGADPEVLDNLKNLKGYKVLNEDTMYDYTKNQAIAKLTFILWDMEDGMTQELIEQFEEVSTELLSHKTLEERFKKLDLM